MPLELSQRDREMGTHFYDLFSSTSVPVDLDSRCHVENDYIRGSCALSFCEGSGGSHQDYER